MVGKLGASHRRAHPPAVLRQRLHRVPAKNAGTAEDYDCASRDGPRESRGELTISQLGAKHGVHQTMINAWKKQAMENLSTVLKASPRPVRLARKTSRSCTQ